MPATATVEAPNEQRPHDGEPRAALMLRSLVKRWQPRATPVLDGLNLQLDPGTLTWVGGRNGAGKTTMLRIAAGLIHAETGETHAFGLCARRDRAAYQRLVSFLPAGDRGLYARLTVRHQLDFWARISMLPPRTVPATLERAIEDFGLGDLAERRVDRMSMGQRQRLRLAMTFMTAPRLLLLDEPLTSLDAEGRNLVEHQIARLCADGGAVLWCSPTGERPGLNLHAAYTLQSGRLLAR